MLTPNFSMDDVNNTIDDFVVDKETRIVMSLHYVGIEFIKNARTNANFQNHTGNLRNSIGYVILNNGQTIEEEFIGGGEGKTEGKNL